MNIKINRGTRSNKYSSGTATSPQHDEDHPERASDRSLLVVPGAITYNTIILLCVQRFGVCSMWAAVNTVNRLLTIANISRRLSLHFHVRIVIIMVNAFNCQSAKMK